MVRVSAAAAAASRRLWDREGVDESSPTVVTAAIERASTRLRAGLGRWIGREGYRVLLQRVHEEMATDQPRPRSLSSRIDGAQEASATIRGFVSVVALLIELLSQVVGEDMAVRLVEQAWTTTANEESTMTTRGARDGQETRSA